MIVRMIEIDQLPKSPGCYMFKAGSGAIIYVGKAKDIRKRVRSYFKKDGHDPKTLALLRSISDVDFIATDNEVEALILENTLIKQHQPRYNIDLKDSKRYALLHITDDPFPRILIARRPIDKGRFFGPFVSGQERDYVKRALIRSFKIRTCKRLPKKACVRYHIGICTAPCIEMISQEDYAENIERVALVLRGKVKGLLKKLEREMEEHSRNQNYESAITLRDQIAAIQNLTRRQKMERIRRHDEDILNYVVREGKVYLLVFNVYKGTLTNKQEYVFDETADFLEEFIVQYYSNDSVPSELIVPHKMEPSIGEYLERIRGTRVRVNAPRRGVKRKLLVLVKRNIELHFFRGIEALEEMKKSLRLNETPAVIECFDISHISGSSKAGAMVQFRYGKPDKSGYRRFRIRTVEGIDDVAAIGEVVRRRYNRLKNEGGELPNLVVVDGGRGQLNAALEQLKSLEVRLPVVALAKEFEELYEPGLKRPIKLDRRSEALKLLQQVRDEAHRFALSYHKVLREREMKK